MDWGLVALVLILAGAVLAVWDWVKGVGGL